MTDTFLATLEIIDSYLWGPWTMAFLAGVAVFFTVAREVGHSGNALIEQRYGHLVHVSIRSDVVEFRLDHYANRVVDQVALMVS